MSVSAELFSVIIPCFNHGRFLPETVASLAAQDWPGLEAIIVDDGSSDDSAAVAAALLPRYPELRLQVLRQPNLGPAVARNTGIAAAGGKWILTLDSDDLLAEGFLYAAAAAIDGYPEINALTGAYRTFDASGPGPDGWTLTRFDPETLSRRGNILNCSPFAKTLWHAVGGFEPGNPWGAEDWHFWIKCYVRGLRLLCLPVPMLHYRQHERAGRVRARTPYQEDFQAMHCCMLADVYSREDVLQAHDILLRMAPQSVEATRRTIARHPGLPLPHFLLGLALEGRGERKEAKERYSVALRCAARTDWPGTWQITLRMARLREEEDRE